MADTQRSLKEACESSINMSYRYTLQLNDGPEYVQNPRFVTTAPADVQAPDGA